eukprot:12630022-Alexandrium_andersonii.AAC.1
MSLERAARAWSFGNPEHVHRAEIHPTHDWRAWLSCLKSTSVRLRMCRVRWHLGNARSCTSAQLWRGSGH